jgi:hypothetical protein
MNFEPERISTGIRIRKCLWLVPVAESDIGLLWVFDYFTILYYYV